MLETLLRTKLFVPPLRPNLVPRPRLMKRLNQGVRLGHKLTLVSAPAGFGKTTLLSTWAQQAHPRRRIAWLSLDEGDNDLTRFLTYLSAALQEIDSNIGSGVMAALDSPETTNIDLVLSTLLNQLAESHEEIVFVLDDYHLIESRPIDKAVTFLLDHLLPSVHLVIATRSDPSISLSRMRGRGQINELRETELRFSAKEAAAFVKQFANIELSREQIAALNTRTEGWISGLQMAAVSMRGIDDVPGFIESFAGDHRYIADYLVDEVLAHSSSAVREFLLRTSILSNLTAPLCDVLSGQPGSQFILEKLERENVFIVPLDQRREWYRYHHLFAELLRHRLRQKYPEQIDELLSKASHWLDENGFTHQAIKHALAMDDKHLAADLVERHARTLLRQSQFQIMREWIDPLPDHLVRERPLLSIYHAWALTFDDPTEDSSTIEGKLAQAQQAVEKIRADDTLRRTVAGHVASIRALLAQPPVQANHDPHTVLGFLEEAQAHLPPSETEIRSINQVNIGYEYLHLGEVESALKANKIAETEARSGSNYSALAVSLCSQALIAYYQGKLAQATEICSRGMAWFDNQTPESEQPLPILGMLPVTLGHLLLERYELAAAADELAKGIDLLKWIGEYEVLSLGHIALTRLHLLLGDADNALKVVERLEYQWPACAALAATLRIQVELSRLSGRFVSVLPIQSWVEKNTPSLSADAGFPGITPWAETQHISDLTWVQAHIALAHLDGNPLDRPILQDCLDYLDRRLRVAQQRGLVFRSIELSVLKALILGALANAESAVSTLMSALTLAEPEGIRRPFLDKGEPMIPLLRKVSTGQKSFGFGHQLLAALDRSRDVKSKLTSQDLVEPLSKRELEVLQLVAQGLSNREIGERLFLALDTVKGHNRKIFAKLGVSNRAQAVTKAIALKIIHAQ